MPILALLAGLAGTTGAKARQVLSGHVPRAARHLTRVGRLAATNELQLAISLPWRNPDALADLLRQLYDPSSPRFRHYLTPQQFTAEFGPTEQDYQAAIQFATTHGLSVTGRHPNRMVLDVRGSVEQVEKALHVSMREYPHPQETRTFYAPTAEPSLDLQTPVLHISGLDNYRRPTPSSLRAAPAAVQTGPVPHAGSGPGGTFLGNDFRAAYVPQTQLTGAGQVVGLFELDGYYASDITAYRNLAALPNVPLQNILIDGFSGTPSGRRPGSGNEEVALDIEMTISMAPGLSKVLVYEASPTSTTAHINDLLNRMATDNAAKQLSCSWGFDIDVTTQQIFQEFAAQGQSFFLASGDSGAFVGAVFQPSDNPLVTVVGGTTLTTDPAGAWLSEETWSGSSGGVSTIYPLPDWQQGIDMTANHGSTTMRNLPDVAMVADGVWVVSDRGRSNAFSGTSIAAPLWAAFTALVNEQATATGRPPVGFLNPVLYAVAKGPDFARCFHDITTGDNTSNLSPDRYAAVVGYDLCTGWGTPTGSELINALLAPSAEGLVITPPFGFIAAGPAGGPFDPGFQTYVLTNSGSVPLTWALDNATPWLDISPTAGTLQPGGPATSVTVSLNSAVTNLLLGEFVGRITFTNLTDGLVQNRQITLLVGNGGFETGDWSDWSLAGQSSVNFIDSVDFSFLSGTQTIPGIDDEQFVHSGIYGAFLGQANSLGSLTQTLPTVPGRRYRLSLWLANPAPGTPNQFQVLWNDLALFDQSNLGPLAWTNLQYVVTASETPASLQLRFRNDQYAFALDDISLQADLPPRLESVSHSDGLVSFRWQGLAGLRYQVQSTTDLRMPAWQDLGPPLDGNDLTMSMSDGIASPGQRFYRVIELP